WPVSVREVWSRASPTDSSSAAPREERASRATDGSSATARISTHLLRAMLLQRPGGLSFVVCLIVGGRIGSVHPLAGGADPVHLMALPENLEAGLLPGHLGHPLQALHRQVQDPPALEADHVEVEVGLAVVPGHLTAEGQLAHQSQL